MQTELIKVQHPEFKTVFLTVEKSTIDSASRIKYYKEQGNQLQVDRLIKESFYKEHDDSEYLLAVEKQ